MIRTLLAIGLLLSFAAESMAAGMSPDIRDAMDQFHAGRRVWIEGDFGEFEDFHGHAAQLGPSGLSGVRPDPAWIGRQPEFGSLDWERILRVHQQVTSARGGAVAGGFVGVIVGALGGIFLPADQGWFLEEPAARQNMAKGAVIGGAAGVVTGWCVGSFIHRWHTIYNRFPPQGS